MSPISQPGLYYDIPSSDYHADPCVEPSLSSSLARVMLAKSPAHAFLNHPRLGASGERIETASMSTGSLIHAILSGGSEIVQGDFKDYRTKAAQEWRDETKARSMVPVLADAYSLALRAAETVKARAGLGITNQPFAGAATTEVTAIWKEEDAFCRARYDLLNIDPSPAGTADIWDWKSTVDISTRGIERTIQRYRYDIQVAFYMRGLAAIMPEYKGRVSFVLVFFETTAPFATRRVTLSSAYTARAGAQAYEAIQRWTACIKSGVWPLTSPETLQVELPAYMDDDDEITIE